MCVGEVRWLLGGERNDTVGWNQNQLQLGAVGLRGFTGEEETAGKEARRREGVMVLAVEEAPVKISGPPGDQLSSITRRIQLQREAERIQHRSVTR